MRVDDLLRAVDAAPEGDLPAIVGACAQAQAAAMARLMAAGRKPAPVLEEVARWLTPEQAAAIAGVPSRRIYSWSKGQRWASRPSSRCLRIHERGFRRWLDARAAA